MLSGGYSSYRLHCWLRNDGRSVSSTSSIVIGILRIPSRNWRLGYLLNQITKARIFDRFRSFLQNVWFYEPEFPNSAEWLNWYHLGIPSRPKNLIPLFLKTHINHIKFSNSPPTFTPHSSSIPAWSNKLSHRFQPAKQSLPEAISRWSHTKFTSGRFCSSATPSPDTPCRNSRKRSERENKRFTLYVPIKSEKL